MMLSRFLSGLLVVPFLCVSSAMAAYPERPIKLISGYAPGGSVDVAARAFAKKLSSVLGDTPIVVENKSGASGLLAASAVANSAPDGYTLYFGVGATFTVMPHMNEQSNKDSLGKLQPIGGIVDYTNILLINNTIPVNTLSELIDYAKKHPGVVTYGSSGIGSSSHLSGEYLDQLSGASMMHVPYKGASQAMTDVLSGQITLFFDVTASALGHVKSDRVKPLAVTSKGRNPVFPDVPTVAESGYPQYEVTSWFGLFAPKELPAEIAAVLHGALVAVQGNEDYQRQMLASGYLMYEATADKVMDRIAVERKLWGQVLSQSKGLKN